MATVVRVFESEVRQGMDRVENSMNDPRSLAARFYDLDPDMPNDVPFYLSRLPVTNAQVLELGCGTGRVTIELAQHCAFIIGIDRSAAMLSICRDKLSAAGISNVELLQGDISDFSLERTFDFIVAPYRVLQNLETDFQLHGLFSNIRRHLSPGGRCILNTFNLQRSPEELHTRWSTPQESLDWEVPIDGGRIVCIGRRSGIQMNPLVLHPELIYRVYRGDELLEESTYRFVMRCYYPDELVARIRDEGFHVTAMSGGYAGEAYGDGTELVVEFQDKA
jgi:SAM-dependent methyltransferase